MDVDEVLTYKVRTDFDDIENKDVKRRKVEDGDSEDEDEDYKNADEKEKERILAMLEDDIGEGEAFDLPAMKRLIQTFEKKVYKNQEMRVKYPDDPTKFLDSEADLHEEIQNMTVLATAPDLYQELVNMNVLGTLMNLLIHENTDVALAALNLLSELLDEDAVSDNTDDAKILVDGMLDAQLLPLLFQNLERLREENKEDSDGIHTTLGILESLCEINPPLAEKITESNWLEWLVKRISVRTMDANRLYASEILAILLQSSDENRKRLGAMGGIDNLLRAIAYYRTRDPKTPEELEMLNNVFDCLCSALLYSENKTKFLQGEGIELMIILLREKKMAVFGAMKTLTFAMSGFEPAQCRRFVEKLGLKSLFPRFMKTPHKGSKGDSEAQFEEHTCSVLAALLRNINDETMRNRLLSKFVEEDFAKVERLLELHEKFSELMDEVNAEIKEEMKEYVDEGEEVDDELRDMFYLKKLDRGLFTLQLVDYIIAELCNSNVPQLRKRIYKLMNQKGRSMDELVATLQEYAENVGDPNKPDEQSAERRRILELAANI